jgi:hypothetical protein
MKKGNCFRTHSNDCIRWEKGIGQWLPNRTRKGPGTNRWRLDGPQTTEHFIEMSHVYARIEIRISFRPSCSLVSIMTELSISSGGGGGIG